MTDIANVRSFNGSSDEIQLDPAGYNGVAIGAYSYAAICTRGAGTGWQWLLSLDGGSGGELSFGRMGDNIAIWNDVSGITSDVANLFLVADGWCLVGVSKTSGTSTPRFHRYRYSDSNWVHDDAATTHASPATPSGASLWLGTYAGSSEWWDAKIACIGFWRGITLSDGEFETLPSALSQWQALSPTGLWLLNQTTTADPVLDRIGSADEIAITGTTVAAEATLAFDVDAPVTGAGVGTMTLLGVG